MRTVGLFFVLPLVVLMLAAGLIIPRMSDKPAFPESEEALEVKARAERSYEDMSQSGNISDWIRNNLIVQRVLYSNYQQLPGSCSGFSDQPKADPSYDRYVDMTEIGLFGFPMRRWHAVCGGRIPLTRDVIVAPTKVEWEAAMQSQQLEHCKKNRLPCGYLGDFR